MALPAHWLYSFKPLPSSFLPSLPSTRGLPLALPIPVWVRVWPSTRFLCSPSIRTRNLNLLRSDQAAFHLPHLITFSRPADGRPSYGSPWLTSSYSHRLDGCRCQYRDPRTRQFLSFVQTRHELSLPQEAPDHVQIPLFTVFERFVHRALWPSFPIGSRSAPGANHAFKRVTCSRWRSQLSRQ